MLFAYSITIMAYSHSLNHAVYTANIYHPAIVKLQPKADKVKEKIYDLMIKGI